MLAVILVSDLFVSGSIFLWYLKVGFTGSDTGYSGTGSQGTVDTSSGTGSQGTVDTTSGGQGEQCVLKTLVTLGMVARGLWTLPVQGEHSVS